MKESSRANAREKRTMFKPLNAKYAVTGMLLASLAGLAHAEGNHDFQGLFQLLAFAAGTLFVMLGQAIYMLALPRTAWGRKFMWVFALSMVDVLACSCIFQAYSSQTLALTNPAWVLLAVVPGFLFIYKVRTSWNLEGQAATSL